MLLCMVLSSVAFAQDLIVKRDGSTIKAKVERVTESEIFYRKSSNLNGPQYTINRSEVNSITYENGEKDVFNKDNKVVHETSNPSNDIITKETATSYSNDRTLMKMYLDEHAKLKKMKTYKLIGLTVGAPLTIGGVILTCVGVEWGLASGDDGRPPFISGIVTTTVGIATTTYCLIQSNKYKRLNDSYDYVNSAPVYQYDFNLNGSSNLCIAVDAIRCNLTHSQMLGVGLRYNF